MTACARKFCGIAMRRLLAVALFGASVAYAEKPTFVIEIKDHLFIPSVLRIPANTKVKLIVINRDETPEEFESYELNREKVVVGKQQASIFIGPLKPGEYPFFGEFHPKTAVGTIIAEE